MEENTEKESGTEETETVEEAGEETVPVSYTHLDVYKRQLYEGCHITAVSRINNLAQRYDRGCEFPEVIITNYNPQERKKWGPQQMNLFSAGLLGGETEDGRN